MKYLCALFDLDSKAILGYHQSDDKPVVRDPAQGRVSNGFYYAMNEVWLNNSQWILSPAEMFVPIPIEDAIYLRNNEQFAKSTHPIQIT